MKSEPQTLMSVDNIKSIYRYSINDTSMTLNHELIQKQLHYLISLELPNTAEGKEIHQNLIKFIANFIKLVTGYPSQLLTAETNEVIERLFYRKS